MDSCQALYFPFLNFPLWKYMLAELVMNTCCSNLSYLLVIEFKVVINNQHFLLTLDCFSLSSPKYYFAPS